MMNVERAVSIFIFAVVMAIVRQVSGSLWAAIVRTARTTFSRS